MLCSKLTKMVTTAISNVPSQYPLAVQQQLLHSLQSTDQMPFSKKSTNTLYKGEII